MGKNNKKYILDEVREIVDSKGFELISEEYVNNRKKLIVRDCNGYYYEILLQSLLRNIFPLKFYKYNPYTIQNIKLWCKLNNKPFELLSNEYKGNKQKLKWQCLKAGCNEIFEMTFDNIQNNHGCGYCDGKQAGLSNCLATKNPELAKQWHPILNGALTPYDVTANSGIYVWWRCSKNPKHEWHTTITDRNNGKGCPYCAGILPSENYNLLIDNSKLCEEWNFKINDKLPSEYTPNSGKKVWWICKECGWEWPATICDRNNSARGCPQCSKSKGEKRCKEFFLNNNLIEIKQEDYNHILPKYNNMYFISQKTFDNLLGLKNGLLSYDFYLPNHNILIEYQGQFHDGTAFNQTKKEFLIQQEHDRRKKEYAHNHNIKLLEIWYWDYDNIEQILQRELNTYIINNSNLTVVF